MRIATFNTNSVRVRLPIVLEWIEKFNPDALCLQETKAQDKDFPIDAFEAAGYGCVFCGQKSYAGVAVISPKPVSDVTYGFEGKEGEEARLIACRIGSVDLVNTYVPQGRDPEAPQFKEKLAWLGRLRRYFESRFNPGSRVVWVGDFNVAPEAIDVYDPKRLLGHVGYHPEEHKALANVKEWGFEDVFRMHHPEGGLYTFWDYRARTALERNHGWRVDHIWATAPAAQKSTDSFIDRAPRLGERPSDHTFLVADFDL